MGWWGAMGGPKQKGITTYVVSPFRQASMRGAFAHWAINGYKRVAQQSLYFAVPLGLGYAILKWAIADNHLRNSKAGHIQGKFA
ncbi:cytochrome b-c1 complex subunit 8 [Leucosporidium creatinivorum]|uniref:Cytochrome b-c1 complex subunit 8 n=1 Tax=Leucosporidium creatinivorum TaxID=106004 RepID=A0A1Y2DDB3_9BASI|nr:cytochrome b-c1 complex subunit 8 [Leucosporidium creatinivorum]